MLSLNAHNVGVAAAQFARLGFDVSVQYGENQPEYDLIVARGELLLKISVKGSQDGSRPNRRDTYKFETDRDSDT